jgi:hypothetical protein
MPEPWDFLVIVVLAYACAVYLSYLQWLSDDDSDFTRFNDW